MERPFSLAERVGRFVLGIFAVLLISPLFNGMAEKLFTKTRQVKRFGEVDISRYLKKPSSPVTPPKSQKRAQKPDFARMELEKGVDITDKMRSALQGCFKEILAKKKDDPRFEIYHSQKDHYVFTLKEFPEYVLKIQPSSIMGGGVKERYKKMVKAKKVCLEHHLDLLMVPNAKLITVDHEGVQVEVIVEKKLPVDHDHKGQRRDARDAGDRLDDAIAQLATFVCKTGYSDVEWRNNPLSKEADEKKRRKIALVDLEHMDNFAIGIYGTPFKSPRGLICSCSSVQQAELVKNVLQAEKLFSVTDFNEAFDRLKLRIHIREGLEVFHQKISTPKQLITVVPEELGLEGLDEAWKEGMTKKEVVEKVVQQLNWLIEDKTDGMSVKETRTLEWDAARSPSYQDFGFSFEGNRDEESASDYQRRWKEANEKRWIVQILEALKGKGHIFEYRDQRGDYIIFRIWA